MPVLRKHVINTFSRLKKQKKTIAIISNSMLRTINVYLNKYQLNKYIDFIYSRDDAGCKKNEEAYWENLIKKHRLKIGECLVIGDDAQQDIVIPQRLGFKTFLI